MLDALRGEAEGHADVLLKDALASGLDPGCGVQAGFHRLAGFQGIHLGVHQPSACFIVLFQQFRGGFPRGWLPKKIALTLALCRALPASIRFRPKRNRKTMTWRIG